MSNLHSLESVERTFCDAERFTLPFGGNVVLVTEDFRQILPVILAGSRSQIVGACLKRSPLYYLFTVLHLRENMRLSGLLGDANADQATLLFTSPLLDVGEGKL